MRNKIYKIDIEKIDKLYIVGIYYNKDNPIFYNSNKEEDIISYVIKRIKEL